MTLAVESFVGEIIGLLHKQKIRKLIPFALIYCVSCLYLPGVSTGTHYTSLKIGGRLKMVLPKNVKNKSWIQAAPGVSKADYLC